MELKLLQNEMIKAMKAKDKMRKDTISALIGNIKTAAINENCRNDIPESLVDKVILKEKKTIQEMIDTCPADREGTLIEYCMRMSIIEEFAPKLMSEEEIREYVQSVISTVDGIDVKNKGSIMKLISPMLKGKADMKMVNQIVTEICKNA